MIDIIGLEEIIDILKKFLNINDGDEATEELILRIGCELLNIDRDRLIEILEV